MMEEHGRGMTALPAKETKTNVKVTVEIPVVYEAPGQYDRPEKVTRNWTVERLEDGCVRLSGGVTSDISITFDLTDLNAALEYHKPKPQTTIYR
jgi:hypothetical protein